MTTASKKSQGRGRPMTKIAEANSDAIYQNLHLNEATGVKRKKGFQSSRNRRAQVSRNTRAP